MGFFTSGKLELLDWCSYRLTIYYKTIAINIYIFLLLTQGKSGQLVVPVKPTIRKGSTAKFDGEATYTGKQNLFEYNILYL